MMFICVLASCFPDSRLLEAGLQPITGIWQVHGLLNKWLPAEWLEELV